MTRTSAATAPLLTRERFAPLYFFSYTFIPLSTIAFPHITIFCLTARRMQQFKRTVIFYPLCILAIWLPCVFLGVAAIGWPDNVLVFAMLIAAVIVLAFGAVGLLLWVGAHDVFAGRLSSGSLTAFIFYAVIVANATFVLAETYGEIQRAAGASERVLELRIALARMGEIGEVDTRLGAVEVVVQAVEEGQVGVQPGTVGTDVVLSQVEGVLSVVEVADLEVVALEEDGDEHVAHDVHAGADPGRGPSPRRWHRGEHPPLP